ncbi:hypothetical protein Pen01_30150 [Phytomonospora endophytica]|nr:hypothetical protein Pen01_30150 [Phytomonospora endophytica]
MKPGRPHYSGTFPATERAKSAARSQMFPEFAPHWSASTSTTPREFRHEIRQSDSSALVFAFV